MAFGQELRQALEAAQKAYAATVRKCHSDFSVNHMAISVRKPQPGQVVEEKPDEIFIFEADPDGNQIGFRLRGWKGQPHAIDSKGRVRLIREGRIGRDLNPQELSQLEGQFEELAQVCPDHVFVRETASMTTLRTVPVRLNGQNIFGRRRS